MLIDSSYVAPLWLRNGHLASVQPTFLRKSLGPVYRRARIETDDGDFLDLDWSVAGRGESHRLVILLHGLEGSSRRVYMRGMARAANLAGWDALAMNFRGCSGQPNRLARVYHSGATDDLQRVIEHVLDRHSRYRSIGLVGFSLGGNQVLKYLGERGPEASAAIVGAVAYSVPVDLAASSRYLERAAGRPYMRYFMRSLTAKLDAKRALLPADMAGFDRHQVARIRSFEEFDGRFTAPLHGFASAEDYWSRSGAGRFLGGILRPTLLVNALNDPFLPVTCYPEDLAADHRWLSLEMPRHGGHVGFASSGPKAQYWSERRAMQFLAWAAGEA